MPGNATAAASHPDSLPPIPSATPEVSQPSVTGTLADGSSTPTFSTRHATNFDKSSAAYAASSYEGFVTDRPRGGCDPYDDCPFAACEATDACSNAIYCVGTWLYDNNVETCDAACFTSCRSPLSVTLKPTLDAALRCSFKCQYGTSALLFPQATLALCACASDLHARGGGGRYGAALLQRGCFRHLLQY
jgi:hypothetical protein